MLSEQHNKSNFCTEHNRCFQEADQTRWTDKIVTHSSVLCTLLHDCMNWDLHVLQDFLLYFLLFVSGAFFVYLCFLYICSLVRLRVIFSSLMLSLQEPGWRKPFNLLLCVTPSPVIARLLCDLRLWVLGAVSDDRLGASEDVGRAYASGSTSRSSFPLK